MPQRVKVQGWKSSGEKTASATIKTSAGVLHGIFIETDGTNDVTAQLSDDTDGSSGTKLTPAIVVPASDRYGGVFGMNTAFSTACRLTLSGTGVEVAIVYYR